MTRAISRGRVFLTAAAAAVTLDIIILQALVLLRLQAVCPRQHALPLAAGCGALDCGREEHGLPQAEHGVGGVALPAEQGSRVAAHACRGRVTCDV
jgi:hypothetical protein